MTDANDAVQPPQPPTYQPPQPPTYQPPAAYQPPAGYSVPAQPPYGQAPYGQQQPYGQQLYGQVPTGYPAPGYPPYGYAPISGRRYWALLFLFYIPYVGVLVAPIVAIVQRSSAMRSPHPIVRENARWAANWALSYVLYLIALIIVLITVGVATSRASYGGYGYGYSSSSPSGWIAVPILLIFGIGIYCLVTMIIGTVKSERAVHRPALAIPFFRA